MLNNDIIRGFKVCSTLLETLLCVCRACTDRSREVPTTTVPQIGSWSVAMAFIRLIPIEVLLIMIFVPIAFGAVWVSTNLILTPARLEADMLEYQQWVSEVDQIEQEL